MAEIFVIGHVNPDMDSIASAVGYAWLLKERDGLETVAARAGALNPQTNWVLKRLGVDSPTLLTDASPRFESVSRRFATITPDQPLREAWTISNRTGGIAPVIHEDGTPYGLVTGWSLFAFLSRAIGPIVRQESDHLTPLMETPSREACGLDVPVFQASARIRDSLNRILRLEESDFFVVDENGRYLGVARQRDLLNPPRLRVILVDHSERSQSAEGIEQAEIVLRKG